MRVESLAIILILILVMLSGTSCCSKSTTLKDNSLVFPRETSLEEARESLGIEIPKPSYLPEGYKIQQFLLTDNNRLLVTISNGSACKIWFHILWQGDGILPPVRLETRRVAINESTGYLIEGDDENEICWNWRPDHDKQGKFEFQLLACKELPIAELLLIARSVGW